MAEPLGIPWPLETITIAQVGVEIMDQNVPDITGPVHGRIQRYFENDGGFAAREKEQRHRLGMAGEQREVKALPGAKIAKG